MVESFLTPFLITAIAAFVIGGLFHRLGQPSIVGYILVGAVLGAIGFLTDGPVIQAAGEIGIVLLLFYLGLELRIERLIANWKIAVLGTLLQVAFSIVFVALIGGIFDWPLGRILLIGYVIALSGTAVALKLLERAGELETPLGEKSIAILLAQDLAIVPMLISIQLIAGESMAVGSIAKLIVGAIIVTLFVAMLLSRPLDVRLRFPDDELKLFYGLAVLFTFAGVSAWFGLSAGLGAFLAGLFITKASQTELVRDQMHPLRAIFVALFFVSVGVMLDLGFVLGELGLIIGLVLGALTINTAINMVVNRIFGGSWSESIRFGAVLSSLGEFSFVLASVGLATGLVSSFGYQLALATITGTLIAMPAWVALFTWIANRVE